MVARCSKTRPTRQIQLFVKRPVKTEVKICANQKYIVGESERLPTACSTLPRGSTLGDGKILGVASNTYTVSRVDQRRGIVGVAVVKTSHIGHGLGDSRRCSGEARCITVG